MKKNYLSYTMALILQAVENGYGYGFDIMTITGLASGTVYPALRRLENGTYVVSKWERAATAQAEQRPPRKYYEVTKLGRASLSEARERFRLLSQLESLSTIKPARQKGSGRLVAKFHVSPIEPMAVADHFHRGDCAATPARRLATGVGGRTSPSRNAASRMAQPQLANQIGSDVAKLRRTDRCAVVATTEMGG